MILVIWTLYFFAAAMPIKANTARARATRPLPYIRLMRLDEKTNPDALTGYCKGAGMDVRMPGKRSLVRDRWRQQPRSPSMPANRSNPDI